LAAASQQQPTSMAILVTLLCLIFVNSNGKPSFLG